MIDTVSNAPMTIDVTHSSMNAFLFIVQRLTKLFTAAVSSPAAAAPDWSPTKGCVYDDIQMAVTRQRDSSWETDWCHLWYILGITSSESASVSSTTTHSISHQVSMNDTSTDKTRQMPHCQPFTHETYDRAHLMLTTIRASRLCVGCNEVKMSVKRWHTTRCENNHIYCHNKTVWYLYNL